MQWIPMADAGVNTAVAPVEVEDTRVSNQEISVTLAGNLNLGSIFTGAVSGNEVGYWLDAMAYSDRYEEAQAPDGLVLANRFGFGLRVMFRVQKLDSKMNLNYGLLGAAIDAKFAQASYEIKAIGFGVHAGQALSEILDGIIASGSLTSDTFYNLNSSILKNLVTYIKTNLHTLQPTRVSALVRSLLDTDSLDTSQAAMFAMRQISRGKTLKDALAAAGDMNATAIRLAYANVMGDAQDTIKPSSAHQHKAEEWLADS
jgi:hypothetical protein